MQHIEFNGIGTTVSIAPSGASEEPIDIVKARSAGLFMIRYDPYDTQNLIVRISMIRRG
jgi:hypothetical protein